MREVILLGLLTLGGCCSSCRVPEPKCGPSGAASIRTDRSIEWIDGPAMIENLDGTMLTVPADERWYPDPAMPDGWRREPKRMRVAEGFKP